MKKMYLGLLLMTIILSQNSILAANASLGNDTTIVAKNEDKVLIFKMTVLNDKIYVKLDGPLNALATVSITNNNGSEKHFEFVNENDKELTIDISKLEKGAYFLMLHNDQEIRILRFYI